MIYRGYIGDILGIYWDNGKENGTYYIIRFRVGLVPMEVPKTIIRSPYTPYSTYLRGTIP